MKLYSNVTHASTRYHLRCFSLVLDTKLCLLQFGTPNVNIVRQNHKVYFPINRPCPR
jgi:hypothetical protein